MSHRLTRRQFTRRAGVAAGTALLAGGVLDILAACSSGAGSSSTPRPTGPESATAELELFSWWTGGTEAAALAELFKLYRQKYRAVTIRNAALAGDDSSSRAELENRLQSGRPPDSFQVHAGQELNSSWVRAGKMEPITGIWHDSGWDKVVPSGLRDIVSARGEIWSVPMNVQRGNAMWASTRALAAAGGKIPETLNDFITLLDRARAAGIASPLALGSKGNWQIAMLLENEVLAVGGAEYYRALFSGRGSFTDSKAKEALTGIKAMLEYVNKDHAMLDWDEAARRLTTGTALVTIMGDWVRSYFARLNLVPGRDFAGLPSPGSRGSYVVVCDSFAIPKGARDHANAANWIRVCGSLEGQAAFNPIKGSIPARTDVPKSLFDPIAQQFMDDFRSDRLVPSSAHGSATPPAFVSAVNDEMGQFAQVRDVNATATSLQKLSDRFLRA